MTAKQKALIKEIDRVITSLQADKKIIEIFGNEGIEMLNNEDHYWYMHYRIDELIKIYHADYTK